MINVVVVIGAGSIGQAIARRVSTGKHVVLADLRRDNVDAAGVSPKQAAPAAILKVDLYGTAPVLEEFGNVVAHCAAGVVIASQSGHRLHALSLEQNKALATTAVEELLKLPFLELAQIKDSLHAYTDERPSYGRKHFHHASVTEHKSLRTLHSVTAIAGIVHANDQ